MAAAISLAAWVAGWQARTPEVAIGGDEATYVILSHSLGQGRYHDEFLAGTPPHAKYPPGTAAWIASLRRVVGPDLEVVRAANLLLLVLTGLLVGDAVRRLAGPWLGVAALAATAFNPTLQSWSGTALSEPPFVFLVTLSLWSTLAAETRTSRRWVLASVAATASFLTRTVGFAALAGIGVWLFQRRRLRHLALHALASFAVIGAWAGYSRWAGARTIGSTYSDDLEHVASEGPGGAMGMVLQAAHNASQYGLRIVPNALGLPYVEGTPLDNLLWLVTVGGTAIVGLVVFLRRWPAAVAYLLISGGVLLAWPWPIDRLVAPLVPIMLATILVGSATLAGSGRNRFRTIVAAAVTGTAVATAVAASLTRAREFSCNRGAPYSDPACYPASARGLVAAARFARDSLPADAVIATSKPSTVYYFGERATVPFSRLARRADADPRALGVDYVLVSAIPSGQERSGRGSLQRHCGSWRVRARFDSNTLILEPAGTAPGDACEALPVRADP